VPTLETPMSPGGSQASAGEGLSPCNIGIGIGNPHSQGCEGAVIIARWSAWHPGKPIFAKPICCGGTTAYQPC